MTSKKEKMSVKEYNEMLRKKKKPAKEINSEIKVYSEEDFNKRTIEHWDEFEGLCREPTLEEIDAWLKRHEK